MQQSHNRSPSDPGLCKVESNNNMISHGHTENPFLMWLHSLSVKYLSLSPTQKLKTLDTLIGLLGAKELSYLTDILPTLLYRDFIRQLPTEIGLKILLLLDEKSLLNCCLVSKYWNEIINSYSELWILMARRVGARIGSGLGAPVHGYKSLFIRSANLVQKMKDSSAFKVMNLEGHRGRVMAITQNKDLIATGSDDHTVRFWDVHTGDCIKLIHTHSVSFLQFDDIHVYTASHDNTAACWDIDTGTLVCRYVGHISAVFSLDSRRDLNLIVTGSADKTVKVWELSSGAMLHSLSDWHNDWITYVKILSCVVEPQAHQHVNQGVLEKGTLQLVSVDRQGCCFWTVRNNEHVDVSVTHTTDWCMNVQSSTCRSAQVTVCTWNKRDKAHCIAAYSTETMDNKCVPRHVRSFVMPNDLPPKQTALGFGQKFAVFMVDEGYSRAVIVDTHSGRVLCSIPVPPFRPTQNGASAVLGQSDWLDGFTDSNRSGLFLALCLKNNNILVLKWTDKPD